MTAELALSTQRALNRTYFDLYPDEAAQILDSADPKELAALLEFEFPSTAAGMLERTNPELSAATLIESTDDRLKSVLPEFNPRRLASLLSRMDTRQSERLLPLAGPVREKELRELMAYPPGTAGHIMDPSFFSFRSDMTVKELLERVHTIRRRRIRDLFVVNAEGLLIGAVPLHEAILADSGQMLQELIRKPPPSVSAISSREQVLEALQGSGLASIPVVDFEGRLVGVIRQDELVHAAQDNAMADIQKMVGVSKEERALSKPWFSVWKRLPWLNINLLTAFLAAAVVGLFEGTIAKFTALAVLLPVVAGQSGNTGAQALAVTMRGLALREITLGQWPRVLFKEAMVGLINGVAIALVTMLGVLVWSRSLGLCIVMGVAMVLSISIASVSGMAIPMLLTRLGQDPAQSSSIILTTITDVTGFLSFLGLATLFSRFL